MPPRTSLRDRLPQLPPPPGRGREAIYAGHGDEVDGQAAAAPPGRAVRSWDEAHKRVTFYCSIELLQAVEAEMRRSERTKTQVIVDALTDHLTARSRERRPSR